MRMHTLTNNTNFNGFVLTSMYIFTVGYIVGLGDRHVQNILVDCNTAELIHIDLGKISTPVYLFVFNFIYLFASLFVFC